MVRCAAMGGRFWRSVAWLAALLAAAACAPVAAPGPATSPAGVTVPAPSAARAASVSAPPIPDWVRRLLPGLELGSAVNGMDLVAAPNIVITRKQVVVEGSAVADVAQYAARGHLARVDPVFDAMKSIRERYKASHPASAFPGVVLIWVGSRSTG